MAAQLSLEGYFVTYRFREWDAFTDSRTNQEVKAGRAMTLFVYTPHDDDLCEVKVDADSINAVKRALEGAAFGSVIAVLCTAGKWGYRGYSAEVLQVAADAV
jgi:hypothetical protein